MLFRIDIASAESMFCTTENRGPYDREQDQKKNHHRNVCYRLALKYARMTQCQRYRQ